MIQSESKQILLSIISISVLIIAFVGISYATVTTVFKDLEMNSISTGTISLNFEDENGALSMKNVMPISDTDGIQLTGSDNVFDFSVESSLSAHTTLNYEIYMEKIDSSQPMLSNSSVRFYLEKFEESGYCSVVNTKEPQPFIPLEEDSFLGSKKGSMILYSGTLANTSNEDREIQDSFRLRMWVSQDTIIDSVSRNFNVQLHVTAKAI